MKECYFRIPWMDIMTELYEHHDSIPYKEAHCRDLVYGNMSETMGAATISPIIPPELVSLLDKLERAHAAI